jgi:hypothetical protein
LGWSDNGLESEAKLICIQWGREATRSSFSSSSTGGLVLLMMRVRVRYMNLMDFSEEDE